MPDAKTVELTVCTKRLAQSVHFDLPGFQAENEYFHMAPNSCAQVTLRGSGSSNFLGHVHALNSERSARLEVSMRPFTDLTAPQTASESIA
jgi:beta-mannosidase